MEATMFGRITQAYRRSQDRARQRREYKALMAMEEHLLRDIGVSRDEVRSRMISHGI
jgi:uncharacterized protein YjiS (DUF1127 family)